MSAETDHSSKPFSNSVTQEPGRWHRFVSWVSAIDEALNTSYDDIQDRRIVMLEQELADFKRELNILRSSER